MKRCRGRCIAIRVRGSRLRASSCARFTKLLSVIESALGVSAKLLHLLSSTEPETVLTLADRILVMKKGAITHEFAGEKVSKDRLLAAA